MSGRGEKTDQGHHMGSLTEFWQHRELWQVTFGDGDSQPGRYRAPGDNSSESRLCKGTEIKVKSVISHKQSQESLDSTPSQVIKKQISEMARA